MGGKKILFSKIKFRLTSLLHVINTYVLFIIPKILLLKSVVSSVGLSTELLFFENLIRIFVPSSSDS